LKVLLQGFGLVGWLGLRGTGQLQPRESKIFVEKLLPKGHSIKASDPSLKV